MDEVSGALIAIGLVLVAVFVPTAFVPGIPGIFYQQFAVTIASARSEEHTSELQSLMRISYAVFCLKKKKKHAHQGENQEEYENIPKASNLDVTNVLANPGR